MTMLPRALLLDTHVAIWLVEGQLDDKAVGAIIHAGLADGVFVSPVSAWEVGLLSQPRAGRPGLIFLPDPQAWFATLMGKAIIKPAPLTAAAAIASSMLPAPLHGDPADRLLIATARELSIPLMTRDSRILTYGAAGHVQTFPI
jgi:PIN domain nuclease of toxin-antitoxin system